ncbi:murein hydrolase activator EnvC family protein [Idiomarina xiamenensis]|uniref:NlpD family metallopeptidase n=1 Tax=Idiomarina xiamenensis 10-D-4 TaxID=740709 RepID=K2KFM7_9GAMM|nr:peptidoglycan DD-metalloendopeptidase family protein [Idiomarina xiamenensis]EKE81469.1 NlpD family metallopeptidase [Idiomarina xiamenensis 10-D-4]
MSPRQRTTLSQHSRGLCLGLLLSCAVGALTSTLPAWAQTADRQQTEAQIATIQAEIKKRREQMASRREQMSAQQQQLRKLELETAQLAKQLAQTDQQLRENQQRIDELETRQATLQQRLQEQAKQLEAQLVSAYTAGQNDFLKMLLNQQNPAEFERMLSYYRYLNQARMAEIDALRATQQELDEVQQQLLQQRQLLAQIKVEQGQQRQALDRQQQQQQQQLAKLQQAQRNDEQSVTQLQQDQAELEAVLDAIIAAMRNDVSLDGLAALKGKLNWPTQGKLQRLFGRSRSGPIDWSGVLIEGQLGQSVNSVDDGRVLFADWLRGFGLLLVVDHGEGYMTLYGFNQALIKDVGDTVRRGEEIALMGQSGGRSEPALYFEVRYRGEPQNPTQWCR